jgi:hypothetical protein
MGRDTVPRQNPESDLRIRVLVSLRFSATQERFKSTIMKAAELSPRSVSR